MICLKIRADETDISEVLSLFQTLSKRISNATSKNVVNAPLKRIAYAIFREEERPLQPLEQPVRDTPVQSFRPLKSPWTVLFK